MSINLSNKSDNMNNKPLKPLLNDLAKIECYLKEINPSERPEYSFELPSSDSSDVLNLIEMAKSSLSDTIKKHRELHGSISKCGKSIEKIFQEKIDHLNNYFKTENEDEDQIYNDALNTLIFDYFLRVGLVDVAAVFLEEQYVNSTHVERDILSEASYVINSMKIHKFEPLKKWLEKNNSKLKSTQFIKFQYIISKLEFLCTLSQYPNDHDQLIEAAKKMASNTRFFQPDFEYLMGSLAFIHDTTRIKEFYSELLYHRSSQNNEFSQDEPMSMETDDKQVNAHFVTKNITQSLYYNHFLKELISMFSQQVCIIKQDHPADPLLTLFTSGMNNITMLYNHDQIRQKLNQHTNTINKEFPLTVMNSSISNNETNNNDQGNICSSPISIKEQHHTIFHCPVDKTVVSGKNSIVRLKCGHAISRAAFTNLTKNDTKTKMKCPYCPHETKTTEVLHLIF